MTIDRNLFKKQTFTADELTKYHQALERDLAIARSSSEPAVMFHFAYRAFIKMGIYCIAEDGYRTKSRPGHHQKIIEYLSQRLHADDIALIGDKMRKDRNLDFYSADYVRSAGEIKECLAFIERVHARIFSKP